MKKLILVTIISFLLISIASAAEEYSYIDLVNQLTDLERLAVLPQAGEKCAQFSSYDRKSKFDEASGKYIDWSANADGTGIIRKEGDKLVLAEMDGPGCIWRIWSAKPQKGHVRIYLDGSAEPAVDLPFIGYFDKQNEPFTYPALVHTVAAGWNCYVPIPYQKSCKIVADQDWGKYYQFTYTTYPKGTTLPTFKRELSADEKAALAIANRFLETLPRNPHANVPGSTVEKQGFAIDPGEVLDIARLTGKRAITAIVVSVDGLKPPVDRDILRELILTIHWDGEKSPSVWTPLGDFFGTGPGANKYKSLPLGVTDKGLYSFWYMPFEKEAFLQIKNVGDKARNINFEITHAPVTKPIETLGRFHAKWHRDEFLPPDPERRAIDWTMLKTSGHGRFVGVVLNVWNPKGSWWGEGDEKFYIDGEKFPSTFGTGSEDYFGYAWCNPTLFENCYHNQTLNERQNAGFISVNRWHITDNIPFMKSFEGAIEKYYPNDRPTLYNCVAYWYLAPGGSDEYEPTTILTTRAPATFNANLNDDGVLIENAVFVEPMALDFLSTTKGSVTRYTTDGTDPTESSSIVEKPISVTEDITLKVRSFREGYLPSPIVTVNLKKSTYKEPVKVEDVTNGVNFSTYKGRWDKIPDFTKLQPVDIGTIEVLDHKPIAGADRVGLHLTSYIKI
ncbi:MAG: DUF2961 domain-containing protein, partial [Planctomycetota bacterium]